MNTKFRNSIVDRNKLLHSVQQDIKDFQDANPHPADDTLVNMLDAYLCWNGIIGYTAQILNIVEASLKE